MKFSVCVTLLIVLVRNSLALDGVQKSIIQSKFLSSGIGCLKDHPLSFSDINKLRNKMLPDGDNAKCFAECLFKKIGIMDDMGKLSAAGARQSAMQVFKNSEDHLSNVEMLVQECSKVNDHDISEAGMKGCDRAKLAFSCLVESAPKVSVIENTERYFLVNDHDIGEAGMKACDRAKLAFSCLVESVPKFGFDVDF